MSRAPDADIPAARSEPAAAPAASPAYSRYVLAVLVLVYVLNFLDRQIITILAEDIKRDLGISDAEIGFLYGTAFAVFYAVFGIPLGRLADVWSRRTLIALGLGFWSLMTALSGVARNFGQLAVARFGVGIGESSATPAAYSMLSDSFPARLRATVIAIYSSGIYIGAGLGILIGGQIVDRWDAAFEAGSAPFGLVGWQAAYLAVGLPGVLLALWVATLREPVRGAMDGIVTPPHPHPFREFFRELLSVLPPLTPWHWRQEGVDARFVAANLGAAAAIAVLACVLTLATGDTLQWVALGIGLYVAFSWARSLQLRDRPTAALVFTTPSLRWVALGFSFLAFTGYGVGGWTPIFFMRSHGEDPSQVGNVIGVIAALGGLTGVTLGGWLADRLRARSIGGRLHMGLVTAALPIPVAIAMLETESVNTAYVLAAPLNVFAAMWIGAGASTVQDLVLPRMRALASALYLLVLTFVGLAIGPYTIGKLSDALGDLPLAMELSLVANGIAAACILLGLRHLARDEGSVRERARAAGETDLDPSGSGVS